MDGWIGLDGWMDGWMDGLMDWIGWMDGLMDGWTKQPNANLRHTGIQHF